MTAHPGANIIPIHGKTPKIHETAFIAPGATIIGDVEIGAGSSIWYNCVVRADVFKIRIGERTNVQDGSILHCDPPRPGDEEGSPLIIGDDVLIGHMAMIHGCTIHDRGFRSARPASRALRACLRRRSETRFAQKAEDQLPDAPVSNAFCTASRWCLAFSA